MIVIDKNSTRVKLFYAGRGFWVNPINIVDVSTRTDRIFIVRTISQEHVMDVSEGCRFIQDEVEYETNSASEIRSLWAFI